MEESNNAECAELKNLKYKTMLLSGLPIKETKSSGDLSTLEKFLESEKNTNSIGPWCKLDRTVKIQKITLYVSKYRLEHDLSKEEEVLLMNFMKDCLERKKLQKVKDVIYDKETGQIKDIPSLSYNKQTKHFTLKSLEKRISTLKSLPVAKNSGTIKYSKHTTISITATNENTSIN